MHGYGVARCVCDINAKLVKKDRPGGRSLHKRREQAPALQYIFGPLRAIRESPLQHLVYAGKQKTPSQKQWRILSQGSDSPLDLVGTEASGTSVHMAGSTVDNRLDTLHIGLDGTVGTSVGVGNLNTKGHALAAKITLSHSLHLLSE